MPNGFTQSTIDSFIEAKKTFEYHESLYGAKMDSLRDVLDDVAKGIGEGSIEDYDIREEWVGFDASYYNYGNDYKTYYSFPTKLLLDGTQAIIDYIINKRKKNEEDRQALLRKQQEDKEYMNYKALQEKFKDRP